MGLGTQVASLFGVLSLDDSDFQRGASGALDTMKNLGSGMQDVGKNLTMLGAPFLALAAVGQNAWDEIDDAYDQLGAVLKSTAGAAGVTSQEASELSISLQNLTGITRGTILGGENMLLTFTNIGDKVFPRATKAMVDLSVAMKQDMKSSAQQLGKALNDPVNGITALTRVGVTFTQQQKDMIESMVKAGDTAGAQGIILAELEKEFGGSAAAAADPIDHLKATLNDLAITVGGTLQPVLDEIIPIIQDFAQRLSDWLNEMGENGDNTVSIILAIGAGLAILGPILAVIGTGLTAIGGLLAVVFSPIGLIIAAVVGLFLAIQNNFLGIRDFLQPTIDSISNFFAHLSDNIALYGSLIKLYAEYYFQGVVTAIQTVIDKAKEWMAQNPELLTMFTVIGIAVGVLIGIMVGLPILIGLITGAVGLLTGALGLLLSPAVLLIGAIAGILFVMDKVYPGGLKQLFHDAQVAAQQLAFLGMYVLANAAAWAQQKVSELLDTLNRAKGTLDALGGIGNLLSSGQITPQQLFNAIGAEISNNAGGSTPASAALGSQFGVQPIPPVGGGSAAPPGANNSINVGTMNIQANSATEGAAAYDGFMSRARAQGAR